MSPLRAARIRHARVSTTRKRNSLRWLGRVVLCVGVLITLATSATGHRGDHGGVYTQTPGETLMLPYAIVTPDAPTEYVDVVHAGMSAWYRSPTRVWPYPDDPQVTLVDFRIDSWADDWLGMALNIAGGEVCLSCAYDYTNVYLNRSQLDDDDGFLRQKVVVHEVGHALGLSHVCTVDHCPEGSPASIMRQGALPYNEPQSHDINDINEMYP